jgi:hypothetical protein
MPFEQCLPVYALAILIDDCRAQVIGLHQIGIRVALAASAGDVFAKDGALRILRSQHSMGAVTVGADGDASVTLNPPLPVHRCLVERELIGRDSVWLHFSLVRVTPGAKFNQLFSVKRAAEVPGVRPGNRLSLRVSAVTIRTLDPFSQVSAVLQLDLLVAMADAAEVFGVESAIERSLRGCRPKGER